MKFERKGYRWYRRASYGYQPFNRLTSTATSTQKIDPNGNTVSKSEGSNLWRYGWDGENRLASASTRKQTVRYIYDALGRRVSRSLGGGREFTKFSYDGDDVLIDDNGGTLTKYQNGAGIDNKLRLQTGTSAQYFLADHLGSTNGLTDNTGALSASNSYDSVGNATSGTFPTRYQFTGREFDKFTGLQYSRARYYDPNLGRFISEDPIGLAGGDVNLYGYVRNLPVNRKDPLGLDDADIAFRQSDYYKKLERQGNDFWNSVFSATRARNREFDNQPENFRCGPGPASQPLLEWLVPESVGGLLGPLGDRYTITPACALHDVCYSTCGISQEQCDAGLGANVMTICLEGGGSVSECYVYARGYYLGVHLGGGSAYRVAQHEGGCSSCPLP